MPKNKDLAALQRRFAAIPVSVKRAVRPALKKGGDDLVNRMRHLAPDEDATGALRDSIEQQPGPVDLSITVVAGGAATTDAKGDDHALNQEYGTVEMERNSFFWPSVNSLKQRVRRRIDRSISKAIKEEFTR